jgi:hypothetical protein
MDMSKVILNSVKKIGVKTSAVQEVRVAKLLYSYPCELVILWEGAVHKAWWYDSTPSYR